MADFLTGDWLTGDFDVGSSSALPIIQQARHMNILDIVKKGSVDRSVTLNIIDSTTGAPELGVLFNTAGIDLWYRREGGAVIPITEVTLATLTTAHTNGGFLEIANGAYRLDLPDEAFETGANYVDVGGTVTGMIVLGGRVRLVDYNPEDASTLGLTGLATPTNITAGTITTVTNLTNAPTAGDLTATMKASIATELATYDSPTNTEMVAAFTEIKGATWATTDTLEAIRDRGDAAWITATGFATSSALATAQTDITAIKKNAFVSTELAIGTVTSQTVLVLTGGPTNNIANVMAIIYDASDAAARVVAEGSYVGGTGTLTLTAATAITITTSDTVTLVAVAATSPDANVTQWGGVAVASANVLIDGAITAAKIAADAITDAKVAADVTIASVTGAVGSVVGGINTGAGTITTLDALDTAQDTQHGTTQTALGTVIKSGEAFTASGVNDTNKVVTFTRN